MKSLVLLSGGQDSTTCLFDAIDLHGKENLHTLTINYGQRHERELEAAHTVCGLAGIPEENEHRVTLPDVLIGLSPLTNPEVELEQYKDHSSLPGGLEKTFVPGRNLLFLSIAANWAYVLNCGEIVLGVSKADYEGYPDCRPDFLIEMEAAIRTGLGKSVLLIPPLIDKTKAQIVRMALDMPGCYRALAFTHTAYDGRYPPIGKDHATLLRARGFEEAGIPDPLVVRAWYESLMLLPGTPNYECCSLNWCMEDAFAQVMVNLETVLRDRGV